VVDFKFIHEVIVPQHLGIIKIFNSRALSWTLNGGIIECLIKGLGAVACKGFVDQIFLALDLGGFDNNLYFFCTLVSIDPKLRFVTAKMTNSYCGND
jgi:hypothetical protein